MMAKISSVLNSSFFSSAATAFGYNSAKLRPSESEERTISLAEVSWHDNAKDCWIIIYDRIYDVTDFLEEHPGGSDILLEYAGRDASVAFRGSGHSSQALKALDSFLIGELPMHERIFRKPGGYQGALEDLVDTFVFPEAIHYFN